MPVDEKFQLVVAKTDDIMAARMRGRAFALALGFGLPDAILITTAIAELTRNILTYAAPGTLGVRRIEDRRRSGRIGLTIRARDRGPGIADVQRALLGGYSTSGKLGMGLSGVRRIMDNVTVKTAAGEGTTVTATKWLSLRAPP